jgi:phosphatidylserine/phosphatidylglycerophosphate/cardiolipin synthase-like enzyme
MRRIRIACLIVLLAAPPGRDAGAADDGAMQEAAALHGPATAMVSVCFVPEQTCGAAVTGAIAAAKTFIRVQAYGFTSPAILRALAAARARGVDVQAILDKSDDRDHGRRATGARFTAEANIPTWIDDSVAIAHNKVIIIDGHLVIGGSYNYTAAAEHRNAENVTFIDAPVVADFYLLNWEARKAVSHQSRYEPDAAEGGPHEVAAATVR